MTRRIPNAEATAYPWWAIVDPRQVMRLSGGHGLARTAGAITGLFFSREAAQDYLDSHRYNYGPHAAVWCFSGHASREYRDLCEEDVSP